MKHRNNIYTITPENLLYVILMAQCTNFKYIHTYECFSSEKTEN